MNGGGSDRPHYHHERDQSMSEANTITENDVLEAIVSGALDSSLDLLSGAIRERKRLTRETRARVAALTTKVGSTGYLKNLSPKYINGVLVKVTKVNQTRLVVEPVNPDTLPARTNRKLGMFNFDGKWSGSGCTVPAQCFEAD